MNAFFEMKQMNTHRNSIPRLKFYDTQHMFHHEYFSSRHNSSAAIMTTSTAGSATGTAISPVAPSRRPDIIKVCSTIFHFYSLSLSLYSHTHASCVSLLWYFSFQTTILLFLQILKVDSFHFRMRLNFVLYFVSTLRAVFSTNNHLQCATMHHLIECCIQIRFEQLHF